MISQENKVWVEEGYQWLDGLVAAAPPAADWILFDAQFFPRSFNAREQLLELLIDDLCQLLSIDRALVNARFASDAPEMPQVPFQMSGLSAGSDLTAQPLAHDLRIHTVHISQRFRPHRNVILHECILRMVDIRAYEAGVDLPDTGEGRRQWLELAAIRSGFGPIMARGRNASLLEIEGGWRTTMTHRSPLPNSVFAFALLHHMRTTNIDDAEHARHLPSEIRHDLKAIKEPTELRDATEVRQDSLTLEEYAHGFQNLWNTLGPDEAIRFCEEHLARTTDRETRAILSNDIGYSHSYLGRHEEAIGWLRQAMELDPAWAYPMDNLGFALIVTGRPEEGIALVRSAAKARKRNIRGYTERNTAVYHWLVNEPDQARAHFLEAFDEPAHVDLLNALYARFLRCNGEDVEATLYEELSAAEIGGPAPDWIGSLGQIGS